MLRVDCNDGFGVEYVITLSYDGVRAGATFVLKPQEAQRLAAELLVAVERAEAFERDMRAPG